MKKRLFVLGLALLLVVGLTGCGEKTDETEQREAENLINGLGFMTMLTDVDAYSGLSLVPGFRAPPWGWEGPNTYELPDGEKGQFYECIVRFPLDSMEVFVDSIMFLLMFEPDIWDTLYQDSLIVGLETWLIGVVRDDIYFNCELGIPDTLHVTGDLKWNWTETWWTYEFDVSTIDESAEIHINSSTNIRLSAQFIFDEEGAGTLDDCWAKFQETTFVKYEFFAEPDPDGYDGYYQLLSEGWKIDHYFKLIHHET